MALTRKCILEYVFVKKGRVEQVIHKTVHLKIRDDDFDIDEWFYYFCKCMKSWNVMFNEPFEFHDWACFLSTWRVCLEILFLEFWNRKRFQISTWLKTTNGEKNIFFQVEILMWIFEVFNAAALVPRKSCYISKSEEDKQNF